MMCLVIHDNRHRDFRGGLTGLFTALPPSLETKDHRAVADRCDPKIERPRRRLDLLSRKTERIRLLCAQSSVSPPPLSLASSCLVPFGALLPLGDPAEFQDALIEFGYCFPTLLQLLSE